MADQIAVVTFDVPAATGVFSVTHPSITETCRGAIFFWGHALTADDGTDAVHGVMGMGFVGVEAGATQEETCFCIQAEDGLTSAPDCNTRHPAQGNCIVVVDGTAAASQLTLARYSSTVAGGLELNFLAVGKRVKVVAILFAGGSNQRAYSDLCTSSVGGTAEAVGGTTDFQADLLVFNAGDTGVGNVTEQDASPNIGFAVRSPAQQVCSYVNAADANEPTDADGFMRSANGYAHQSSAKPRADALNVETATIAIGATSFTATSSAGSPDAHFLALKFDAAVRLACANMPIAAATGLQSFNAFGFTPDLVLGMATLLTSVDSEIDGPTASCSCFFVTGRFGSHAVTWHHAEGITLSAVGPVPSLAHTRQEEVALLQYDHQGNIVQRATWAGGSGSGGFALDFSVADEPGYMTALGIQIIPTEPIVRRRQQQRARTRTRPDRPPVISTHAAGIAHNLWQLLRETMRFRRKATQRRLARPLEGVEVAVQGQEAEEGSKGRVFEPGMQRGGVVAAGEGSIGKLFTPGLQRGKIVGGPGSDPDQ